VKLKSREYKEMSHIDERLMLRYVSEKASDDEIISVDAHIVDCQECFMHLRALFHLHENFDSVWTSWTATEHGRVCRQWNTITALEEALKSKPTLAKSAKNWVNSLDKGLDIFINAWIDRIKHLTIAAGRWLPNGYSFEIRPIYMGIGDISDSDGVNDKLNKSSELLLHGEYDAAIKELDSIAKINARITQSVISEINRGNLKIGEVISDSRQGRISVKLWPKYIEAPPFFALLIPEGEPHAALLSEFEIVDDTEYLLAEFRDIDTGLFNIIW